MSVASLRMEGKNRCPSERRQESRDVPESYRGADARDLRILEKPLVRMTHPLAGQVRLTSGDPTVSSLVEPEETGPRNARRAEIRRTEVGHSYRIANPSRRQRVA